MRKKIPTLIGLFLLMILVGGLGAATRFSPRASTENTFILPPAAANISEKSFVVYWITATQTDGAVSYGTTSNLSDGVAKDESGQTHFVWVTNLKPGTKYYFQAANQASQEITTLTDLPPATDPFYGKISDGAGVLAVSGNFAAISKDDGSFVIPAAGPVDKITLYRPNQPPEIYKQNSQKVPTFATPSGGLQVNLENNSNVSSPLPTISGKAGPNQVVKITIHSDQVYTGQVIADPAGNWTWTPPAGLSPGLHTATITIVNSDGTTQTATRTFTVVANSPILPITSGTPSAQPIYIPPARIATQSVAGGPPPVTGAFENTLFLLTGGFILVTLGGVKLWADTKHFLF